MRSLTMEEVCQVSGGTFAESIEGIGEAIATEIGEFFEGMNENGEDLGNWLYEMFGGSGQSS